jgi:hypothetical protein
MKPEKDYRNLSKSWLKYDGNGHILLAATYAFIAGNTSFFAAYQAIESNWLMAILIGAVSSVLWAKAISNGVYAAHCLKQSK